PLAAIGAIASFIGLSLIGIGGFFRVGVVAALVHAIVAYLLTFVVVFVVAWLVDTLAPTFGGQRDSLRALKVTVYSYTPAWVAAVLNLVPALAILGLIAALSGLSPDARATRRRSARRTTPRKRKRCRSPTA